MAASNVGQDRRQIHALFRLHRGNLHRKMSPERNGRKRQVMVYVDIDSEPHVSIFSIIFVSLHCRTDDNIESLRKRFVTNKESTMPIVSHFEERGLLKKIDATRSPDEVYGDVKPLFQALKTCWNGVGRGRFQFLISQCASPAPAKKVFSNDLVTFLNALLLS